jgi:hypothetical protein
METYVMLGKTVSLATFNANQVCRCLHFMLGSKPVFFLLTHKHTHIQKNIYVTKSLPRPVSNLPAFPHILHPHDIFLSMSPPSTITAPPKFYSPCCPRAHTATRSQRIISPNSLKLQKNTNLALVSSGKRKQTFVASQGS